MSLSETLLERLGEPDYRGQWSGEGYTKASDYGTFRMYILRREVSGTSPEKIQGIIEDDRPEHLALFVGEMTHRALRFVKRYSPTAQSSARDLIYEGMINDDGSITGQYGFINGRVNRDGSINVEYGFDHVLGKELLGTFTMTQVKQTVKSIA